MKVAPALLYKLRVQTPEAIPLTRHQQAILRHILAYVIAHPEAKDTLEGIRQWWGLEGRTELGVSNIQQALHFLVARDWVTEREVTPSPHIYGVNKERLTEITTFLQTLQDSTEKTEV